MVVTRFPPSPTGALHIGGARTALYSWLYARQNKGRFVLRIEDTDVERSTQESVQVILDAMQWLGLDYDEGPHYQTQRIARYKEVIAQLVEQGDAYYCPCPKERLASMREQQKTAGLKPKYDGHCRGKGYKDDGNSVVRFKNPLHGNVIINDTVKGDIAIANQELDDVVLARSDGMPTYQLTVVVDDMDMGVTHVVRGDDHINNTPRQINILRALSAEVPYYAHVAMILGNDGARLSKRHGAVSVLQYRDVGYLPEALLNYLVRLGWSHGDQEIFSVEQMIKYFDLSSVSRSEAAFDPEKLLWVNQQHLSQLCVEALFDKAQPYFQQAGIALEKNEYTLQVLALIQPRCKTLCDVVRESQWFFSPVTEYEEKATKKWITPVAIEALQLLFSELESMPIWQVESIHEKITQVVQTQKIGFAKLAQPIRIAISGSTQSPSIDESLFVLGKSKALQCLTIALARWV